MQGQRKRRGEPTFIAPIACQNNHERAQDDGDVEPRRCIAHIPFVQRVLFFGGDKLAAMDLRPPREPRRYAQTQAMLGRLVNEPKGARADQRHVPHDDIKKLGKLVKPSGAEKPTNGREALRVLEAAPACVDRMRMLLNL